MIIKHNRFRKLVWTAHSEIKMKQYGLSKSKLSNILRRPERKEKGIVPGTTAVMMTNKTLFKQKQITVAGAWQKPRKAPGEIWLMYKDATKRDEGPIRRIISAWRYPGITKPGDAIPIPEDIMLELLNEEE
jgi:hypothetical protein